MLFGSNMILVGYDTCDEVLTAGVEAHIYDIYIIGIRQGYN